MTRRILITRPEADAGPLQAQLTSMGFESLLNPVLTITYDEGPNLDLTDIQAILFTSANGVRAFVRRNEDRTISVFTVGDASTQAAQAEEFVHVESAHGDVHALSALVKKQLVPESGGLLHIAASRVAGDLARDLEEYGFQIRREILYTARVTEALRAETITAMKQGELDAVLLFSPRTAITFVMLIKAAGLEEACRPMTVFCLSAAVAKAAEELAWAAINVAPQPKQDALLNLMASWST